MRIFFVHFLHLWHSSKKMGFLKLLLIFKSNLPTERALHEKPYFPSPGTSWKAQKDQVNTIFASDFWLIKDRIPHLRKDQNKNFSVISKHSIPCYKKYHLIVFFEN